MKLKKMFGALLLSATLLVIGATVVNAGTLENRLYESSVSSEVGTRTMLGYCDKCGKRTATIDMIYGNWIIDSYQWDGSHQDIIYIRSVRQIINCSSCGHREDSSWTEHKRFCPSIN